MLNKLFSGIVASMFLLASITGCARQALSTSTAQLENRIWDSRLNQYVSRDELMASLQAADYILLGETHDNPAHHEIQTMILQRFLEQGIRPAIVMEMLDLSDQAAIDRFSIDSDNPDAFDQAVGFSKKGWDWSLYEPFLQLTLANKLAIRAGNLPRSELNHLVRGKPLSDYPELNPMLDQANQLPDETRAQLRQEIVLSHCGKLPENMVAGMMTAQTARDAMLALQLKNAGKPAILITGSGHARLDRAVPFFLSEIDPNARVISLGMKGVDAEFNWDQKNNWETLYDFSWYTKSVEREDPCEKFKVKSANS